MSYLKLGKGNGEDEKEMQHGKNLRGHWNGLRTTVVCMWKKAVLYEEAER